MSASSTDRNLLFGILALQMDFIDRGQLIEAMNAWALDKSRTLGEILVEKSYLEPERHELLEALVREHLKQHDNDPAKSLGAVSSIGLAQKDLEEIADADVQQSLSIVSQNRQEDPNATLTYSVGTSTSEGQRFRILRPHAEGALGKVSVAQDEELNREIALKELKDFHADKLT